MRQVWIGSYPRTGASVISAQRNTPGVGAALQQDIEIALAVTRVRLLDVHAVHALELIEHARGQLPAMRALDIYLRLHQLEGHTATVLHTRVVATLGNRAGAGAVPAVVRSETAGTETSEWDSPRSWLTRLRRRLRGRTNRELRRWVELHTGRTEVELLRVHVDGALRVVDVLNPADSFAEAIDLYTRIMGVPSSLSRAIYFLTLQRLSDRGHPGRPPSSAEPASGPPAPATLRIASR
jgi:hypothetical protein